MGKNYQKSKRAKHERARDRALVAEYHLKGLSFEKIKDELNNRLDVSYTISTETARLDYLTNVAHWNEQALAPTGADIAEQETRLRLVEVEAWAAWERSKDPAETIREVQKLQDITDEEGKIIDQVLATETIETLIKGQVGDEKFLRIILDAWDKRARLQGMYVHKVKLEANITEKHEHTFKMYEGVNPTQWDDPTIEVIDGQIVKDGNALNIKDGIPRIASGNGDAKD